MRSKIALAARSNAQVLAHALTAEQRLNAFLQHCQLMTALAQAGRALRRPPHPPRR